MAQREGTTLLILTICTFVLFGVMVVLYFLENAKLKDLEAAKLKADKATADAVALSAQYNKQMNDARKLVGGPEAVTTWPGEEIYTQKITDAQNFLNELFRKWDNRAPVVFHSMVEPYDLYKDLVSKMQETRHQAQELLNRSVEDQKSLETANKTEVKGKDDLIAGLKTQISETESKYEKRISELTRDNERLQKEMASVKDQMASEQINCTRQIQYRDNIIASLRLRLEQLTEESRKTKTIEDVEPDGQILEVAGASQIGWINIGRRHHLRPGLEFRVFQNVKGGKRQYKGRVEVRRIDEAVSEFRILETDDELNPIIQGDQITSPFYDPKQVPVFVIAGEGLENKDVTEETLKAKLRSYGAQISNEVDLKTSFVIALKNYEKSPLYKTARELGVAVLRERDILEYMGL